MHELKLNRAGIRFVVGQWLMSKQSKDSKERRRFRGVEKEGAKAIKKALKEFADISEDGVFFYDDKNDAVRILRILRDVNRELFDNKIAPIFPDLIKDVENARKEIQDKVYALRLPSILEVKLMRQVFKDTEEWEGGWSAWDCDAADDVQEQLEAIWQESEKKNAETTKPEEK